MARETLKRAAMGFTAIGAVALSSSVSAAPISLRAFAIQEVRVATIAYRLNAASANSCRQPQLLTGMLLHDLSQYEPSVRASVSRAFSLGSGFGIIQIVPGSAADRAGLRIDDEIIAVGGAGVEDPKTVARASKSYRRMGSFAAFLQDSLRRGTTEMQIRRNGVVIPVKLQGDLGCGGELSLLNSNEQNAWSDGISVAVTTGMMRLARSDDELAFVVAHEMAHNLLGHSHSSVSQIFGGARRSEIDADQMAVSLMTYAGYQPEGGISFLETVRRRFWWNISLDHPGFGSRIRAVNAAIANLPPRSWQFAAATTGNTSIPRAFSLAGSTNCAGDCPR